MQAGEECQDSVFSDESCPVEYRAAHRNTAGISVPFYRRRHGLSKVSCFAKSLASICSFRNYTLSTYYLLGLHLWCSDEQNGNGSFPQGGQYLRRKTDTLQHTHIYLSICLSVYLSFICLSMHSHDFTLIPPIPIQHHRVYLAILCSCKSCEKPGSHCLQ